MCIRDRAGTEQTPYVVVACAGLAALYAFLFLFTERDFRALSVIARDADRFDDACSLIAAENGLSKREAEILPFALKGRTGERIAAEFYISKSTVDKMCIRDRPSSCPTPAVRGTTRRSTSSRAITAACLLYTSRCV